MRERDELREIEEGWWAGTHHMELSDEDEGTEDATAGGADRGRQVEGPGVDTFCHVCWFWEAGCHVVSGAGAVLLLFGFGFHGHWSISNAARQTNL